MGLSPDLRSTLLRKLVNALLRAAGILVLAAALAFLVLTHTNAPTECVKPTVMPATWYGDCR